MKYMDLSHTFKNKMPVFPGDSISELKQVAFYEQNEYNAFYLQSGMHVGTHIDAPFHMYEQGKKLSELSPEHFIGKAKIIDVRGKKIINKEVLQKKNIERGDILLICTGHSKHYNTEHYYRNYPVVSSDFAEELVTLGIKIIGFDSPSPDEAPYTIHKILFQNNILIIENLTGLEQLIDVLEFEIIALPAKFESAGAPVRVVAKI